MASADISSKTTQTCLEYFAKVVNLQRKGTWKCEKNAVYCAGTRKFSLYSVPVPAIYKFILDCW